MVERDGHAFYVGVEYKRLPSFCNFCHSIGHSVEQCRKKPGSDQQKVQVPVVKNKVYVPKNQDAVHPGKNATINLLEKERQQSEKL